MSTSLTTRYSELIRGWLWMQSLKYCRQRYIEGQVKLNSYSFRYVDWPSFVHQYHDIFVRSIYGLPDPKSIKTVLDCGVNVGSSMVYFLSRFPNACVWGWEADASIYDVARSNLAPYPTRRWSLENRAVWHSDQGMTFFLDGADAGSFLPVSNKKILIPSLRLLDKIADFNEIDLLKLDIEGAEYQVVKDISSQLEKVRFLFVEVHLNEHLSRQFPQLIDLLISSGFDIRIEGAQGPTKAPFLASARSPSFTSQLNIFCRRG